MTLCKDKNFDLGKTKTLKKLKYKITKLKIYFKKLILSFNLFIKPN